jgi:peptidoglycan/LPS O-acetylase OafA/YrhL
MSAPQRLPVLDMLRGIASFAVCWFHLTNGNVAFLPAGILKSSGAYGWLGVEVFFVISGFVIPYALERSRYGINDCGTFLL